MTDTRIYLMAEDGEETDAIAHVLETVPGIAISRTCLDWEEGVQASRPWLGAAAAGLLVLPNSTPHHMIDAGILFGWRRYVGILDGSALRLPEAIARRSDVVLHQLADVTEFAQTAIRSRFQPTFWNGCECSPGTVTRGPR